MGQLEDAIESGQPGHARRAVLRMIDDVGVDEVLDRLARPAAAGSALATELLVEQVDASALARKFVNGVLLDETAVDEVSQDTLISVANSIQNFRGDAKFTTWLHRIARNRAVDYLRRRRDTAALDDSVHGASERMSSMIATRSTVRDLLEQLPDHYRETVTGRDLEGLSYDELADQLDRSVGTVKSQVARGRALVASMLAEPVAPIDDGGGNG